MLFSSDKTVEMFSRLFLLLLMHGADNVMVNTVILVLSMLSFYIVNFNVCVVCMPMPVLSVSDKMKFFFCDKPIQPMSI